jgi:hypothetical protein
MNTAIITLVEYEEDGTPYTKVYRVEYEGNASISLREWAGESPEYIDERVESVCLNFNRHVATEQLKA